MGTVLGNAIGVPFARQLGLSCSSILTDGTTSMRWVERDGCMCMDLTLTATGFAGVEDTDWVNVESIRVYGLPLTGANTINDWFLPSQNELLAMYNELHANGAGRFTNSQYWSSTESLQEGIYFGRRVEFNNSGALGLTGKAGTLKVRACRAFSSVSPSYSLRDIGPAGGLIFYVNGDNYMEAAPYDQSEGYLWSDVFDSVPVTDIDIGTGQANTTAIIAQVGHTDSAAKLCDDLVI